MTPPLCNRMFTTAVWPSPWGSLVNLNRIGSLLRGIFGAKPERLMTPVLEMGVRGGCAGNEAGVLQLQMAAIGENLLAAIRRERELGRVRPANAPLEVLAEWRARRRSVEQLGEEYQAAVTRWRHAILAETAGPIMF